MGEPVEDEPTVGVGDPLYLPSPEEAVPILEAVVADWDFETLARYYDFSRLDDLEVSGVYVDSWPEPHPSWFTDEYPPHVAIQPDPVVRFSHPFPPTFEYVDHEVDGDVATVVVEGSWDTGFEDETQAGRWAFKLRRHDEGWQVLPDPVEVIEGDAPP